jgi:hypothetical protein
VGIATRYGLDGSGFEPWLGVRFIGPIQTDPAVHPASCTIGAGSLSWGSSGWGVELTTHPFLALGSNMGTAILLPPPVPAWHVTGQFVTDSTPTMEAADSSKTLTCTSQIKLRHIPEDPYSSHCNVLYAYSHLNYTLLSRCLSFLLFLSLI